MVKLEGGLPSPAADGVGPSLGSKFLLNGEATTKLSEAQLDASMVTKEEPKNVQPVDVISGKPGQLSDVIKEATPKLQATAGPTTAL